MLYAAELFRCGSVEAFKCAYKIIYIRKAGLAANFVYAEIGSRQKLVCVYKTYRREILLRTEAREALKRVAQIRRGQISAFGELFDCDFFAVVRVYILTYFLHRLVLALCISER